MLLEHTVIDTLTVHICGLSKTFWYPTDPLNLHWGWACLYGTSIIGN